jgi:heme-degrading monooxygenase HmoA
VPASKSQKGYKGAYLLTDRDTGKGMSITIWDTEEDAVANERSGYYQELRVDSQIDGYVARLYGEVKLRNRMRSAL